MTSDIHSISSKAQLRKIADFCTLSPEDLEQRVAMIRREILPRVLAKLELEDGVGWEFEATADNRKKLEELTELERQCCRGLSFEIREDPNGTRLRWEILGIDPNTAIFGDLNLEPAVHENARAGSWKALLRRGGLGAVISIGVCCVLPIGLVSLVGVGFAAPFTKLDNPWIIAVSSVVIAGGIGWIENRRGARRAAKSAKPAGQSCDC